MQQDFLRIRVTRSRCVSVFIAQGEERSQDAPADLLIGWRKRGGSDIHVLAGWGLIRPL